MAGTGNPERSGGDRNRRRRLQARRLTDRQDFWEVPEDDRSGRAHRRSRTARQLRRRSR